MVDCSSCDLAGTCKQIRLFKTPVPDWAANNATLRQLMTKRVKYSEGWLTRYHICSGPFWAASKNEAWSTWDSRWRSAKGKLPSTKEGDLHKGAIDDALEEGKAAWKTYVDKNPWSAAFGGIKTPVKVLALAAIALLGWRFWRRAS